MAEKKKGEWQIILEAQRKAVATRMAQLRAARLARDAALPLPPPAARRARKKPA
jgi:hypothetical protein